MLALRREKLPSWVLIWKCHCILVILSAFEPYYRGMFPKFRTEVWQGEVLSVLPILLLLLPFLGDIFALSHSMAARSRRDYPVQALHRCMAAQAQASNSQVSLTHCMTGSNTCVGHKLGQSSGGNKQKQTAGTADSKLIAINSSLVCFGVVRSTARTIDCAQVCFARRFIHTFWFWKDTELLHMYYAQKGDFPSGTFVRSLQACTFYSKSNSALCIHIYYT